MSEVNGRDSWSGFHRTHLPEWTKSSGILFNTVEGFDRTGLSYFERKLNKPVWSVEPILLPIENRTCTSKDINICKDWLDSKPETFVLFVSFGSMNTISPSQMMGLA
ncbi:hypothetical protein V6N13_131937 [Hibiscus sabdariffa]